MLLPKRVKYRRVHRGRMKGKATRGNFVSNGDFGLMATGAGLDHQQPDRGRPYRHDPLYQNEAARFGSRSSPTSL